jgi:hypothetical protein
LRLGDLTQREHDRALVAVLDYRFEIRSRVRRVLEPLN